MGSTVQPVVLMDVVDTGRGNRASTLINSQNQYKLLSVGAAVEPCTSTWLPQTLKP